MNDARRTMQRWESEWAILDARIEGLRSSAAFLLQIWASTKGEGIAINSVIMNTLQVAVSTAAQDLETFATTYSAAVAPIIKSLLDRGIRQVAANRGTPPFSSSSSLLSAVSALVGLRHELEAARSGGEVAQRRLVERAFVHLQQSINVDPAYRALWVDAFQDVRGEERCEHLGAIHLLKFGIWSFKVHGPQERTDLVLQQALALTADVDAAAEAMALTEWKLARTAAEAAEKVAVAREQARLYSTTALAATELATVRYAVVVTAKRWLPPGDITDGAVTYRHINVAVDPDAVSVDARKQGRKKGEPSAS
jgi:hypothetical protein